MSLGSGGCNCAGFSLDADSGVDPFVDSSPVPSTDEDDDGISNDDEGMASGVDTDGDGIPDWQDADSDADGVDDVFEGALDPDCDGLASFRDADSDGDAIPDSIEGPAGLVPPSDFDGDGSYDFADLDSDDDGLPDGDEDLDGDGLLGDGESGRLNADTDGDGYSDLLEWAAGSSPQSPLGYPDPDEYYFVLPYLGLEQLGDLDFSTSVVKADVLLEVDTTSSMGGTITTLSNTLQTEIVPQIALEVPNTAFGAAWFKDFPIAPFGGPGDLPFHVNQRITTDISDVQDGIDDFLASGGGDGPESGIEAFYQAASGEGIDWTVGAIVGEVPKFEAAIGFDAGKGHGALGGAGFRVGALPMVIHISDIESHDAPVYVAAGIVNAHSLMDSMSSAVGMGLRFIALMGGGIVSRAQLESLATGTGALVPPMAWGPSETFCHTGVGGALRPPNPAGLCPLVFDSFGGAGDTALVDGIKALVNFAALDISMHAVSDPDELPDIETSLFVTAITPVPPAPAGATIDGDVFRNVLPGSPVTFRIHLRNTSVEHRAEAQLFDVRLRIMGDEVTVLDERVVHVIVPGGSLGCE